VIAGDYLIYFCESHRIDRFREREGIVSRELEITRLGLDDLNLWRRVRFAYNFWLLWFWRWRRRRRFWFDTQ